MAGVRSGGGPLPGPGLSAEAAVAAYQRDRLGFLLHMARRYGPVTQLSPGTIMITGPAEVDAVFRRTDRDYLSDRDLRDRNVLHRPGSAELRAWLTIRRAGLAAMTHRMVGEHAAWLADRAEALVSAWLARGQLASPAAELEPLTSASIARFCFGTRDASGVPAAAQAMLDALFPVFASTFEFPSLLRAMLPREWRVRRRHAALHRELRRAVSATGEGGLVDVAARAGLGDSEMSRLLTSVHLAAHGVPAAALAWALVEVARNPRQQQSAADSVAGWDGTTPVPAPIGWIVDEALRLWPPSWLADRVTQSQVPCADWTIPAGSQIVLPLWVIHRLAPCYEMPDTFMSERWATVSPGPGEYVPFGRGPHWCLGARFSRAEMTTVLAVMLRRARFALHGEVRADARRTLTPVGFTLDVRPR
jgi:unspecific monooxygenase